MMKPYSFVSWFCLFVACSIAFSSFANAEDKRISLSGNFQSYRFEKQLTHFTEQPWFEFEMTYGFQMWRLFDEFPMACPVKWNFMTYKDPQGIEYIIVHNLLRKLTNDDKQAYKIADLLKSDPNIMIPDSRGLDTKVYIRKTALNHEPRLFNPRFTVPLADVFRPRKAELLNYYKTELLNYYKTELRAYRIECKPDVIGAAGQKGFTLPYILDKEETLIYPSRSSYRSVKIKSRSIGYYVSLEKESVHRTNDGTPLTLDNLVAKLIEETGKVPPNITGSISHPLSTLEWIEFNMQPIYNYVSSSLRKQRQLKQDRLAALKQMRATQQERQRQGNTSQQNQTMTAANLMNMDRVNAANLAGLDDAATAISKGIKSLKAEMAALSGVGLPSNEFSHKTASVVILDPTVEVTSSTIETAESEFQHLVNVTDRFERFVQAYSPPVADKFTARTDLPKGPSIGDSFRDCDRCPEMVIVPSGSFMMGSPSGEKGRNDDEGPQHRVTIAKAFAVGKTEVTFAEWDACVQGGGCNHRPNDTGWGRGKRPVIHVSWNDAKEYVKWLSGKTGKGYRLLSEAEWEYAARGGTSTRYSWGDDLTGRDQCKYANGADLTAKKFKSDWTVANCDDGHYRTSPVGSYSPNQYGLYDMHGNVWEWVEDCYHRDYGGAPVDGSARVGGCSSSSRVLRGGSWVSIPQYLRSAYRNWDSTGIRFNYFGFRIARDL